MKGKPDLVKASRVSEAAKKVGGVYVVAARNPQLPQAENASAQIAEFPLAEYSCKECATVFASNEGLTPHCLTCGSSHVECSKKAATASAGKGKLTIHADAELSHYACQICATNNIFHTQVAKAVGDAMYCVMCGTRNEFASDMMLDDIPTDDTGGDSLDDLDLVDTSEDAGSEDTTEPTAPSDVAPVDPAVDGTPSPTDMVDAMNMEDVVPPTNNEPTVTLSPVVDPEVPEEDTPPAPAAVVYSEEDDMDMNLLDTQCDTPMDELSFVWLRENLALASTNQLIATLSPEDAGKNADIMETQEFARAVGMMIKDKGIKAACEHYGFKPVVISVPIKKAVAAQVEKVMADKVRELESKIEAVAADFTQSTQIAATGVVKNFWKDVQDPLRAALVQELSAVGVRNPSKLLDKVWASHAGKFLSTILEKAKELTAKTVEARNELVDSLDMVNPVPTRVTAESDEDDSDDDEEDEDEDGDTVESRLSTAAVPVTAGTAPKTGNGRSIIRTLLAGREGHFNS